VRTVAGIDCGTNSIRLLVARSGPQGLRDLHREMRVVRLGEGVDATGRMSDAALERTRAALSDYAGLIERIGVDAVRMVATSASRDAENADRFARMVTLVLGVPPEVITGDEEARLSFMGALANLNVPPGPDPLLVADIGGGSTELVLGSARTGEVMAAHSMDVGCVRMTERHLHDDPPTAPQIVAVVRDLRAALRRAAVDVDVASAGPFVGVAGTVTTVAAIALGLPEYLPSRIHGSRVSYEAVRGVTGRLLTMTRAQRADLPVMHPGRVDVIGAGALILQTLMEFVRTDAVIASEHDILDGIAMSLL
jgi:exopolyphosphatase/guanosine-5'-triphosphate,3'-diphosphate pyrophosphatase